MTNDTAAIGVVVRLTQSWARVYTRNLPRPIRDVRRAEIDSDVWEWLHDDEHLNRSPVLIATLLVVRLIAGIPDDLAWSWDHHHVLSKNRRVVWPLAGSAIALALMSLWLWSVTTSAPLPTPPAPLYRLHQTPTLPPPPPPPPPPRRVAAS